MLARKAGARAALYLRFGNAVTQISWFKINPRLFDPGVINDANERKYNLVSSFDSHKSPRIHTDYCDCHTVI